MLLTICVYNKELKLAHIPMGVVVFTLCWEKNIYNLNYNQKTGSKCHGTINTVPLIGDGYGLIGPPNLKRRSQSQVEVIGCWLHM